VTRRRASRAACPPPTAPPEAARHGRRPGLSESTLTDVVIPLCRNLRFQTFWTGSASAALGQAVGDVAYPLAIVTMTGPPGKAALFSAVQFAGMLVAGLPVGSLADRYDTSAWPSWRPPSARRWPASSPSPWPAAG